MQFRYDENVNMKNNKHQTYETQYAVAVHVRRCFGGIRKTEAIPPSLLPRFRFMGTKIKCPENKTTLSERVLRHRRQNPVPQSSSTQRDATMHQSLQLPLSCDLLASQRTSAPRLAQPSSYPRLGGRGELDSQILLRKMKIIENLLGN